MNADDFINELVNQTDLNADQAAGVNEILNGSNIIDDLGRDQITALIIEKLGVSQEQADQIYDAAMGILKQTILDKINPFKK